MLEQDQVDTFQRQGAVLLKGVFREFVDGARAAIEENIANPSWRERTYRPDDGGQAFFQDYVVWDRFDGYRALVRGSRMPAMAAQLMGSRTARVFHDHILVKEPGNSVVTPWHQDQPYYLCDGRQTVSFWVPLDDIPRERTIEYVAGSHLWGVDYKPQRFDGTDLFQNDTSEAVPDVEALRDEFEILGWAMEPGDAVAFPLPHVARGAGEPVTEPPEGDLRALGRGRRRVRQAPGPDIPGLSRPRLRGRRALRRARVPGSLPLHLRR
jgi:ectoine hydroxylase-related dioxygenase (phytanoyl-CoA dioxygenase family)